MGNIDNMLIIQLLSTQRSVKKFVIGGYIEQL